MTKSIEPFRVEVAEEELADLRSRLRATRWPDREVVPDWSQGVPLAYMQEVCAYWAERYDWRAREARLNSFPQFRTEIDGLGIHFLHVRSPHEGALPLLLTHGWPGSVVEFLGVIPPLVDPTRDGGDARDAFHVVAPSLPGYAFSDKPREPGWGVERIARAWRTLMERLGYERYVAQGGDWGSMVTTALAQEDPEHCVAIHLNMPVAIPDPESMSDLTDFEKAALESLQHYNDWESGYSKLQSTRPQTLGYALVDSPAGQAAWILEKFWAWTDSGGHPENVISRDDLLDNVMLYWVTRSAASSARLYWESFRNPKLDPVDTPTGCSIFPKEILRTSRRWAERRFRNLVYWNELPKGGHFAAFEQPGLFVQELRACFRAFRR
ncbi:MAG: hydrolase [Candidatus Binatia bacterium]|nr:MAG: hydrolase [Candidatus Binatia bacterium]